MAKARQQDPVTCFCFKVVLPNINASPADEAYFKSVSGLKYESEVVDFKEGGFNVGVRRLVGPAKWPNLVLKRGFTGSSTLFNWRRMWLQDSLTGANNELKRVTGKIFQLTSDFQSVCSWEFKNGWPCKWEGPEYDASKSELAIETLEIAHEGLFYEQIKKS